MVEFCSTHRYTRATHRCDDCDRLLCADCFEVGHKLLFCRHCGERALALPGGGGDSAPELERHAARAAPYGPVAALAYPLRGVGLYLTLTYVVLLVAFDLLAAFSLIAGLVLWLPRLLITLSVPGLLFAIVRSTAAGDNELPDWPDWSDIGRVIGDIVGLLLSMLVSMLPLAVFLYIGCGDDWGVVCWLVLAATLFLGALLWVPAFGVVGVYENALAALRIDLHLAFLTRLAPAIVKVSVLVVGLTLASLLLQVALVFVPLLGGLLANAVGVYGLLLTPHLVGLLFRREEAEVRAIYG